MIGALSTYTVNQILDDVFGGVTYTPPANLWFALYTDADPTVEMTAGDAATMAGLTEVTGGSYARVALPTFAAASGRIILSSSNATWPTATALWGTFQYVAIMDSATPSAGNCIAFIELQPSLTVDNTDILEIASGNLSLAM